MFIDTHAHLNYPEIIKDIEGILQRASENGVEYIIVPATNLKTSLEIAELTVKYEIIYGAAGFHPTELSGFKDNDLNVISEIAKEKKIVAIGEAGLDYYWEPYDKNLQAYVLEAQIDIAKSQDLPIILHNRNSSDDLMNIIIRNHEEGKLKAQFHSFSGDRKMAAECLKMGFYLSFTGNITYKPKPHTHTAINIIKESPLENLLLETDSPYLAPVPFRGKSNEPSYIVHTAEKIAEIKNITPEKLGAVTSDNARRLFNIP